VALVVRPWAEDDAPALSRAVAESLEHLRPWMPWAADEPRDDAWRRAWIRDAAAAGSTERIFGAWVGDDVVGACGLHARVGPGTLEIGYWTHAAFTRRGIATEMARRLTAIAFEDPSIGRVEIHHEPDNVASARVPEKLGFTRVGTDEQGHVVWRLQRAARPGRGAGGI
jgi:RimJ/RimL family protein N-acetyltransferase